jgi:pyridoxamine 5'-phosphate oxidase
MAPADPLKELGAWLTQAEKQGVLEPRSVAFVTVGADGRPSARTVTLKRLEPDSLVFTSALWTRKATELADNPSVALLFHWPELGRQAQLSGTAQLADRALAEELFAERDIDNRLQAIVSRQGEAIADLTEIRARRDHLAATMEAPPACPEDWGAIRFSPTSIELWVEAEDRLHERLLYELGETGWTLTRLAP